MTKEIAIFLGSEECDEPELTIRTSVHSKKCAACAAWGIESGLRRAIWTRQITRYAARETADVGWLFDDEKVSEARHRIQT